MSENDLWNKSGDEPRIPSTSIVSDAELGLEEEPPELEATELELAWYRAVARNMRFYGRQWFLALSGAGMSFAGCVVFPYVRVREGLIWNSTDVIVVAMLVFVAGFSLLGYWAFRSGSFPARAPKKSFSDEYDISITRSGLRYWMGMNVLLAPASILKRLHRGKSYEGEGFFVSKGGDDWLVPTKIGDWQVSSNDRPEPMNRVAGWLVFSSFQFGWIGAFAKWEKGHSGEGLGHLYYVMFWVSLIGYLGFNLTFLSIIAYRAFIKKRPEVPGKD